MRTVVPAFLWVMTGSLAHGQESWDAHYVGGSKIGYTHTFVEKVPDPTTKKEYLRVRIDMELKLKRDKDVTIAKMQYGTIETLKGEVLRLDTRTLVGEDHDLRAHGDVIRGEMVLQLDGNGERQSKKIPWGPDVRGPYAPEQSMARNPMKELGPLECLSRHLPLAKRGLGHGRLRVLICRRSRRLRERRASKSEDCNHG